MRTFIWTDELTERVTRDIRRRSRAEASVVAWLCVVFGSAVLALLRGWASR
jgi:hypothetical protein